MSKIFPFLLSWFWSDAFLMKLTCVRPRIIWSATADNYYTIYTIILILAKLIARNDAGYESSILVWIDCGATLDNAVVIVQRLKSGKDVWHVPHCHPGFYGVFDLNLGCFIAFEENSIEKNAFLQKKHSHAVFFCSFVNTKLSKHLIN